MIHKIRQWHRKLTLFFGLQLFIWTLTGVYMVWFDIHDVHGEHLVAEFTPPPVNINYQFADLLNDHPEASNARLVHNTNDWFYLVRINKQQQRLSVATGQLLPQITQQQAVLLAKQYLSKDYSVVNVAFFDQQGPAELASRHLPVWQVTFDHWTQPTFYIGADSALLVTKRSLIWRGFDWMWRFHIGDYDDGENPHNYWLTLLSLGALVTLITGVMLLVLRLKGQGKERVA